MCNELISVIVPVYNSEKYLENCIQSLLKQTHKGIEIILVDDGSKDNSPNICNALAQMHENIKVIHRVNGGVATARNSGLDVASGEYITFIDNDDYIEVDTYEILLREIKKSDADICKILINFVDENGKILYREKLQEYYTEKLMGKDYRKSILLQKGDVCCWSKLFKREVLKKYRFLDGRWNEDFLLMYRIMSDYEYILSINEYKYNYVQRKDSFSKIGFNQGYADNIVNAKWALDLALKNEPDMVEYAIRLYFHQIIPYILFMPIDSMNNSNQQYLECRFNLKKYKKEWKRNLYLSKKEKIILSCLMCCPNQFRRGLELINYKGWYR